MGSTSGARLNNVDTARSQPAADRRPHGAQVANTNALRAGTHSNVM